MLNKNIKREKGAGMMMKRISLLLLALVCITSLAVAVVGCGDGGGSFTVSNLVINPTTASVGQKVEISQTIANSGGASGQYNTKLIVNGVQAGDQTVEVAAGSSTTVTFDYTPSISGTLNIELQSSAGTLSGTLPVTTGGDYEIPYKAVAGTLIVLNYSLASASQVHHLMTFDESDGIVLTMVINKSAVNGQRAVTIPAASWVMPKFTVEGITRGVDMGLVVEMTRDGTGTLYVQDGVGDVDLNAVSTSGQTPIQVNEQGDGTKDPGGSMVVEWPLIGYFDTTIGEEGHFPFDLMATTGHSSSIVHISTNKKMDGATMSGDGVPFAKSGGEADYVGTPGTLITTGTGECLGIRIVGMRIDLQLTIKLVLEPAD